MEEIYKMQTRNEKLSTWANGKFGRFVDIERNYRYRFAEYCPAIDPPAPMIPIYKRQTLPVIVSGFVAFIFKTGFLHEGRLREFFFKYDVFFEDKENIILPPEDVFIARYVNQSKFFFDYISKKESDVIKGLIAYYYDYIRKKISNIALNEFLSNFIPDHVRGEYVDELKNIFLSGYIRKRRINWESSHREMRNLLKPYFDDGTIPGESSWADFVVDNFLKKNKLISKKTVFNEKTRPNWG